jgi:hypothetical protein
VVAAIAAILEAQPLARRARKRLDHIRTDRLTSRVVERCLCALGIYPCLIADGFQASDTFFQSWVLQIGQAGLDRVVEPVEPLLGLSDAFDTRQTGP